jgi:DNA polymerase III subunit beta
VKVRCSRARLSEALSAASMVVPPRSAIPVLLNVRLTASRGPAGPSIEVACTDLEFGLRLAVPASEVGEEGVLLLPLARMAGILRESSGDAVAIDSAGHVAHIGVDGSSFKLVGMDPADFPKTPDFEEAGAASVDAGELASMIRKTRFAVSTESVRYVLTGQLFEVKGGEIRMVGCDGKRLAYARSAKAKGNGGHRDIRVVVPTKAMDLLEKVLSEDDEKVGLNVGDGEIRMRTRSAVVFSRLIEGSFPDYESVVPSDSDKRMTAPLAALLGAVRKVALMTTDRTRAVKLTLGGGGKCALLARTQDVGEAMVDLPVDYVGEPIDLVLNPDFIVDYLRVVTDPAVELHLRNRTLPAVFRAGKNFVYVVMPLNIDL